uniref:Chromosome segregation protein n=1 Tax=Pectobacterium carotovorum TaxID=554 RepID=A0A0K0MP10_PECCA|nr:chromosome segregation protein [Pectobacterium carotovorum]
MVSCEDGDLTKGTDKLTQEFIEKLIGASKEVFLASIYASQENMPDLPGMTDKNLKAIVEEAAGVDRLTHSYEIARDKHNAKLAECDGVAGKITVSDRAFISALETAEEAAMSSKEWEKTRTARIVEIKKQVELAEIALTEHQMANESSPTVESIDEKIKAIRAEISSVTEHDAKVREMESAISKAKSSVAIKQNEIDRLKAQAKKSMTSASAVAAKVGVPCSECGRPYCEEDLETVKKSHMDKARSDMAKISAELAPEITTISEKVAKAETALTALKVSRPNVDAELEKIAAFQRQRTYIEKAKNDEAAAEKALKVEVAKLKSVEAEINPFTALIEKTKKRSRAPKR